MEQTQSIDNLGAVSLLRAGGDGVATSPPEKEFSFLAESDTAGRNERNVLRTIEETEEGSEDVDHQLKDTNVENGANWNVQMTSVEEQSIRNSREGEQMSNKKNDSPVAPSVQTQTRHCCDKEDHICFDCFPIPDKLLEQIRHQTGMSKLACLQTVQTVVQFYKQDLVYSKYLAHESTDDDFSEYSHSDEVVDDSALLFRATPLPLRREKLSEAAAKKDALKLKSNPCRNEESSSLEPELDFALTEAYLPIKLPLKLCGADKFRDLVRRLKLDFSKVNWNDARNNPFMFTFFRKFNKVVTILDKSLLRRLIREDDFEFTWTLAKILRKLSSFSIQSEIVGILGTVTACDSRIRKYLLESNFAVYLSRVIMDPETSSIELDAFASLLTVLFTGGKPLPIFLMEHFGLNFVLSILDIIENNKTRSGCALPDVLVKLLLAYNLQFSPNDIYNNITILGISRSIGPCKTLTSLLMTWMDQKDGPLSNSWEVNVSLHQSASKMIADIFLCRTTSHAFSVEQSVVLITLLSKSLSNFKAGDKRRTSYLRLIYIILRHCKYDYIRNTPCLNMNNLEEILLEGSAQSDEDQELIRSIFKEFPQLNQQRYNHY